ncbi:hypothetical protein [Noviherbaspirillum agri]
MHNAENQIVKSWAHKSWVTCLLSYKEIRRSKPFSPGNYSELFFLDEATAFAAGHRPCTYCQRARSNEFKTAWLKANVPLEQHSSFLMSSLDSWLHNERALRGGGKVTYEIQVSSLPNGTMFEYQGNAYLVHSGHYLLWSFEGYRSAIWLPTSTVVAVLTPRSIVAAFQVGFTPKVHPSAAS